ncbi:Conserved_hypothetical protein [Hexamita inflata]|uniref:Uncharacterized protein n=2 Tax=Hexamita inflata TaxID=28002 RepID=A0ABP1K268_9EUKA
MLFAFILSEEVNHWIYCDKFYTHVNGKYFCYNKCPADYPISDPSGKDMQCRWNPCPIDTPFKEVASCVKRCSTGAYELIDNDMICVSSCGGKFALNEYNTNSTQCLSCPADAPFYENGACVARCASSVYVEVNGTYTKSLVCQEGCSNFYYINVTNQNSKLCLSKCYSHHLIADNECLQYRCPPRAPYRDDQYCYAVCPNKAYMYVNVASELHCMPDCGKMMYIINSSNENSKFCIMNCPEETPYYETGACLSRCTSGSYKNTNVIYRGRFILKCQQSCNLFVLNVSNGNSQQCVDRCPSSSMFSESGLCSVKCASGMYEDNYGSLKCVPSCSNYMQINVQNGNQKQCVDRCSGYVQENICVNKCPTDSYSRVGDSYVCQAKCDKVYVQSPYNKLKQCFNECPSSYKYLVGKECKDSLNKAGQTNIALIVVPVVAGVVVLSVLALCFYKNKKQNGATKIAKKQKVNVNMPASMTYV